MKEYQHLMLDIESLSSKDNAVITSIAAVAFDMITGETGPEFKIDIQIQDSINKGLEVNGDTIVWWLEQSNEARKGLTEGQKKAVRLDHALFEFTSFVQSLKPSELRVWGNSCTFDNVLLRQAYNKINKPIPWKYVMDRDVRTIVEFAPEVKANTVFVGTKHDPINDCKHQIKYLVKIYNKIKVINE